MVSEKVKRQAKCRRASSILGRERSYRRVPPGEVFDLLDRRALFERRWGHGSFGQKDRLELETRLLEMWRELSSPAIWSAGALWRSFDAEPRGGRKISIGVKPATFLAVDPGKIRIASGEQGAVILQAVTLGARATGFAKAARSIAGRFLWHGLAAEAAEALAEWCSREAAGSAGWNGFRRISPGFPVWPELAEQRKLFRILRPGRIGISLKRSLVMEPEYSTSAMVYPI